MSDAPPDAVPRADPPGSGQDAPALDEPAIEQPAVGGPGLDEPAIEQPAVGEPGLDEPGLDEPGERAEAAGEAPAAKGGTTPAGDAAPAPPIVAASPSGGDPAGAVASPSPSGPAAALPPGAPPGAVPSPGFGGPTQPVGQARPTPRGASGVFGGAFSVERIGKDVFTTFDLGSEAGVGPVRLGMLVPLRVRIYDGDPQNDGLLRSEDWDEISDYARVLRYVEVGLQEETWRLRSRFGTEDGESLGHGTILAGYYNTIDRDHYQAGLVLDGALRWGGAEFLMDNLLAPEILGWRLHLRPGSFVSGNEWAQRLVAGWTLVGDIHTPEALLAVNGRPVVDEENRFQYAGTRGVWLMGLDAEYALVQNPLLDLVPYMDLNFLFEERSGVGFHLGSFFNLRLPELFGTAILTRLEYRALGPGYAPRYVDSLYEVQRVQYDPESAVDGTTGLPLTKLGWLRARDSGASGWLGELFLDLAGWVKVGVSYEDASGPDNSALTLSLLLPRFKKMQGGVMYTRRGFEGASGAFDLDGALLLAWARVPLEGPFYMTAAYTRTWRLQDDGTYRSEGDFNIGAGVAVAF